MGDLPGLRGVLRPVGRDPLSVFTYLSISMESPLQVELVTIRQGPADVPVVHHPRANALLT